MVLIKQRGYRCDDCFHGLSHNFIVLSMAKINTQVQWFLSRPARKLRESGLKVACKEEIPG